MPRFGSRKPKDLIRILEKNGFVFERSRGSHFVYFRRSDKKIIIVPMHAKDLPKGTLFDILKQAGVDWKKLD